MTALSRSNSQTSALYQKFSSYIMNHPGTPYTYKIPFICHSQVTIMGSACACLHLPVCVLFSEDRSAASSLQLCER